MSAHSRQSKREELPPNFFIIGAPKAGSSSLWHALRQHPDVFMPKPKEPNFFCDDAKCEEVWYRSLFEGSEGYTAIGEASVAYSLVERNPGTPARLASRVPAARLLYIVRHPLRRIESAWLHHVRSHNPVPRNFGEAVRTFRPLLEGTLYMRNLNRYRRHLDDEQICVIFLEDLAQNPETVLATCDRFLGVDPGARQASAAPAKNISSEAKRLHPFVYWVRQANWWPLLRWLVPGGLRRLVAGQTRQALPERPAWDAEARAWALRKVRQDARALLEYARKPPGFWRLDPAPGVSAA